MSEHYIQSQYLIKKITDDFFDIKSDTIRVKDLNYNEDIDDISIQSDETDESLEKIVMDDKYFYLDSDKELSSIFDICDNKIDILEHFTIYICPYKMNKETLYPFLEYYLTPDGDELNFPSFEFQCANNITSSDGDLSSKDVYFQNECMKTLLKYVSPNSTEADNLEDVYKGFSRSRVDKNILYVVFDIEHFIIKKELINTTIFEIINTHKHLDQHINKNVNTLFIEQPTLVRINDSQYKIVKTPQVLYKCFIEDGKYKNEYKDDDDEEFISLIDKTTDNIVFGDNTNLFTCYPISENNLSKLKRFAVFIENPVYVLDNPNVENKPNVDEGFSLGKILPAAVDYFSKDKKTEKTKEEEEEREGDEEETEEEEESEGDEEETEEEEESEGDEEETTEEESEGDEDIVTLSKDKDSVYYHQLIDNKNMAIWMIKSSRHFIEI